MELFKPFTIEKPPLFAVPIIPYQMECASHLLKAIDSVEPDCIVTDLPLALKEEILRAASRLPDPSLIRYNDNKYLMVEVADPAFEAVRRGLELGIPVHFINPTLFYGQLFALPDPYAIYRLGMKQYWHALHKQNKKAPIESALLDSMAKRLKNLTFSNDKILFAGNIGWIDELMQKIDQDKFQIYDEEKVSNIELGTLTEESLREVPASYGWLAFSYEAWRDAFLQTPQIVGVPDKQKLIYLLYKQASLLWSKKLGTEFTSYHWHNLMKFTRNWSLIQGNLLPSLYQIIQSAKGCVEDSFALATWELATDYPFNKNIDNLPRWNLKPEEVWGNKKSIHFRLKEKGKKSQIFSRKDKQQERFKFSPPGPFTICSYQPEDKLVENFADFLKKKGKQILSSEGARTVPFSGSLEDGIDVKETIRHFAEHKLYVKTKGKPPGAVGSIVIIFNTDEADKYPWKTTWLGEHTQESDMAFYSTHLQNNVIGPGISRCEYGGFMMSYPPRRLYDIWRDPDYYSLNNKAEVLLMAAIDYSVDPLIVYCAEKPPRSHFRSYAARFGKKIVYFPLSEISPITRNKIRTFHVLDGHNRRSIADEYII